MGVVIQVENLSKAYQLGDFGTGTISRDLERYWARIRSKEDPFLKIGETNDRTTKSESDIVWSLRDLNLVAAFRGRAVLLGLAISYPYLLKEAIFADRERLCDKHPIQFL
jgi:hypothetical protein